MSAFCQGSGYEASCLVLSAWLDYLLINGQRNVRAMSAWTADGESPMLKMGFLNLPHCDEQVITMAKGLTLSVLAASMHQTPSKPQAAVHRFCGNAIRRTTMELVADPVFPSTVRIARPFPRS